MYHSYAVNGLHLPGYEYFVVGLIILFFLFIYWFSLIMKIVIFTYVLKRGPRSDIRDEEDEKHSTPTNGEERGKNTNGEKKNNSVKHNNGHKKSE